MMEGRDIVHVIKKRKGKTNWAGHLYVASHECLGRAGAVGTWDVVVILRGNSAN